MIIPLFEDVEICANRLFGPPPQNATYLCLWQIQLGEFVGSASISLIQSIVESAGSFSTGFSDVLDSIAEDFRIIYEPDVTFLSLAVKSVDLTCSLPHTAVQLSLSDGLRFDSNDFPGKNHKTTKSLAIPSVKMRSLLARSHRYSRRAEEWFEVACATFDIHADVYGAPSNWKQEAERQKLFAQSQDNLTTRAPWIYDPNAPQPSGNQFRFFCLSGLTAISCCRLSTRPLSVASCRSLA